MSKFLLDENIPISTLELFRDKGHDVIHIKIQGLTGLPDDNIMEIANREAV